MMDDSFPTELLAGLGLLILERESAVSFRPMVPLPVCFGSHFLGISVPPAGGNLDLTESDFLADFLSEAEEFWKETSGGRLNSGPWIEVDEYENEYSLKASAVSWQDRKFLIIEILGADFQESRSRLQNARELFLSEHRQRSEAQRTIQEAEAKYQSLFDQSTDAILVITPDGEIVTVNVCCWQLLDLTREELVNRNLIDLQEDAGKKDTLRKALEAYDFLTNFEWVVTRSDGSRRYCLLNLSPWRDRRGTVSGYLGIARDVTERREAEELLRKSEEKYRAIIEGIEEGYYEVDLGGNLTFCNDSMSRILGYSSSELIGTNYRRFTEDTFAEKVYDLFMKVYETGKAEEISGWLLLTKDGVTRNVDASVTPVRDSNGRIVGFRGICRDVTQVVALKKQLFQAQKMEAIGNLAGGIAHDFNNILNVALGFAELAQDDLEPGHPALDHIREIRAAGERGAHLVNQILALSRETEKELRPLSATPIVKEVLRFLRASMPTTVDIRRRLDAKHDTILADPTQLHQILMNLCTNAGHAMRQTGGILEVRSDDIQVDETAPAPHPHMERGRFLKISVRDTGHGIPPELQERIFEPYFTTKRPGEGTGLGLAVVHGIVKNYGGHIAVQSEPDAGTTVEVFLPVVEDDFTADEQLSEELPRGNESILYVDDEPAAVRMGKLTLERLGYRVVTATDSLKALELFRSEPEGFDAVITDMTMPGLTGSLLADLLLATRSDIPIILCTGYTDLISEEKTKAKGIKAFLTKPVSRETLAKTVREVLES